MMVLALTFFALFLGSFFAIPFLRRELHLEGRVPMARATQVATLFMTVVAGLSSFTCVVNEGDGGILKRFGAASNTVLEPGLNFKWPFETVEHMSTRASVLEYNFDAQSADLQKLSVKMTITYRRKFDQLASIYKRVRLNSEEIDVVPAGREITKAEISEYKAPDIIARRAEASAQMFETLNTRLNEYGLEVVAISIGQIDFDDLYDHTVEQKVIAGETAKMKENELTEQLTRAQIAEATSKGVAEGTAELARGQAEAQRLEAVAGAYKTQTLGLAEAAKVRIEGQAEAERQQMIARALRGNPEVLRFEAARAWDGSLPSVAQGLESLDLPFMLVKASVNPGEKPEDFTDGAQGIDTQVEEFLERILQRQKAAAEAAAKPAVIDVPAVLPPVPQPEAEVSTPTELPAASGN